MQDLSVAVFNVRGNTCKSPPQAGVNVGVRPECSVEDPHCVCMCVSVKTQNHEKRRRESQVCVWVNV